MVSLVLRIGVLVILAGVLAEAFAFGDSSCLKMKTAEECRGRVEEGTGEPCVWCACKAIPSECLGASMAKKLPKAVFTCDDVEARETGAEGPEKNVAEQEALLAFEVWKEQHGVSYSDAVEEERRLHAFRETLKMVTEHNKGRDGRLGSREGGKGGYTLELNRFADMTWDEFRSTSLGFGGGALGEDQNCSATHTHSESQYRALGLAAGRAPPATRDWRDLGAVSVVKDQKKCGSCWTFSTTGCLESHHYLRSGKMVLLSEQQLVDCAGAYDNHGCSGGLPSHAFQYIAAAGGLDTEDAYPYLAHESGKCSYAKDGIGADVIRSVNITFQDEAELLEAVGNTGPVSIAFQVAKDFIAYAGGVYDNPGCSTDPQQVNHAVLAVGYGTTDEGVDYWIIKNSWSAEWGIDGYFHMVRDKNMCGVADCASFPLVP